jgi:cysteine desulfurase family protein (TIGR01976 family)
VSRDRFPGLQDGWARFDGPAGTQMVDSAIEAMAQWMRSGHSANSGGLFAAGAATDALVDSARETVGRLLGAEPDGVVFGPSMTALTFHFSAAVGRTLRAGDEIVCTRLDHDANVWPWMVAAERAGARVRLAEPDPVTLELPVEALAAVLSERTAWVAITAASNAMGTVPPLAEIVGLAHAAGARVYVDAVHAVAHRPVDVARLGCDAVACSAYKWYGPHAGLLWARPDLLGSLAPDALRPAPASGPGHWQQGTTSFESVAGIQAAAEFVLETGYEAIKAHEEPLLARVLDGLRAIPGITVHGDPSDRVPTVMFSHDRLGADELARALAAEQVAVWHGSYYAWELARLLDLPPAGAIRAGVVHYTDAGDVDRLLAAVEGAAASAQASEQK